MFRNRFGRYGLGGYGFSGINPINPNPRFLRNSYRGIGEAGIGSLLLVALVI